MEDYVDDYFELFYPKEYHECLMNNPHTITSIAGCNSIVRTDLMRSIHRFITESQISFINISFDVLINLFETNLDNITFVPDIIVTTIYIKTMRILGLDADYDSHIADITENCRMDYKIIPEIVIGNFRFNIHGIMPVKIYQTERWQLFIKKINYIKEILRNRGAHIEHAHDCEMKKLAMRDRYDMLVLSSLENCTCPLKINHTLALDLYYREGTLKLNNYLKFNKRGKNSSDKLIKQRFYLRGRPLSFNELCNEYSKSLLNFLQNYTELH
jgi:hypothetical protein